MFTDNRIFVPKAHIVKRLKYTPGLRLSINSHVGAQLLSGRALDSRPRGRGFEPHGRHCVVVLEPNTFILA